MVKHLLNLSAIVIILIAISSLQKPVYAQTFRTNSGYLQMMVQLALQRASFPLSKTIASPTPTVYMQPTPTPTVTSKPTTTPIAITGTPIAAVTNPTASPSFPTATPVPTTTPKPTSIPTPTAGPTDHMTYIMNEINKYRQSQGLSDVTTSTQTCNFAATRAHEITTNFSHDGFQQRIDAKTIPYTSWTKITENLAETPDYTQVVTLWKNSPGHAANMRENTPYVCVRGEGNYYAYEGMKP